jgi:hypothetical protein
MLRFIRIPVVFCLALGLSGQAFSVESKEEKMKSDESQAQYQRKSITYLGVTLDSGVNVPPDHLNLIEKGIRKQIELKRFDFNAINLASVYTIDQFVNELREYVKKRSVDRATAESEYEARFKRAKVLASDIDRIMSSAYFYMINVFVFKTKEWKCPASGKLQDKTICVPNATYKRSTVNASVSFYHVNLLDESKPPYTKLRTVKVLPAKEDEMVTFPPEPPPDHDRTAYNAAVAAAKKKAQLDATRKGVGGIVGLAARLSKEMKKIPEFQLKTPVTAALSDGVEFMLGKGEGVRMDDTYDVTEFDAGGKKSINGYVKVRNIGDAKGSGEGSPSYAEKVKEKRKFVGGEQLYEHPMLGVAFGIHGVLEMCLNDLMGVEDGMQIYPGAGLYVDFDMAPYIGWPEFYVSVEADMLFLGSTDILGTTWDYKLAHGMLGFKKKWYITSLVVTVGVRGGISYFLITSDDEDFPGDSIGVGGDLVLGLEYYVLPEFSVYLKAAGRFFGNPTYEDADPEMGANVSLGVFLAL